MIYRTETRGRHTFPGVSTRLDMFHRVRCDYGEQSIVVQCGIPGVIPLTRVDRPRLRGEFFPGGALKARPADRAAMGSARFFITRPAHEALKAHRLAREIRAGR